MDVRALAARGLAEIALAGISLRAVAERDTPRLADARDRALLTALLSEGARWWLRYDALLPRLLDKPLRQDAVRALLVLGMVQMDVMGLADYAAVAASVEATRALGQSRLSGLVNALLRRFQRERARLTQALDDDPCTRTAHPPWLIEALHRDWPDRAEVVLAENNRPAPPTLRVNARRADRETVQRALAGAGCASTPHPRLPDALLLEHSIDVTRLPGFSEGWFSVQDGAAQFAVDLLDLQTGMRVLDACAAPGGKACHALERADVRMTAIDREASRLPRLRQNLERLDLHAEVRAGDAGEPAAWWDGHAFDRILIDAPCSASGVIRRRPDVKLHRRAADIPALAMQQRRLCEALWPLLAPGGRLVYATCSLLREENETVAAASSTALPDACIVPLDLPIGRRAGPGWQLLPGDEGMDGMFYAVFEKSCI